MKWSLKDLTTALAYVSLFPYAYAATDNSAIASEDSAVVKLTAETFNNFIKENPLVLLEFFAPWCGHCKNLGPEFATAADELLDKDIKLAQVDCTEERDLCQDFEIGGYPTLKVFKSLDIVNDYKGGRTSDSIVTYMLKQSLPPVSILKTEEELDSLLNSTKTSVVIQIANTLSNNESFYQIANELNEKLTFVSVDTPIGGKLSLTKAKYIVIRPGDDEWEEFTETDVNPLSLREFSLTQSKPLFGVIDGTTFQDYMSAGLPLAYYFHETDEEREAISDLITKLAKQYRGEINFVSIDASKFGKHAVNLNMEEKFPLFAIHNISSNHKYGLNNSVNLVKELDEFVSKFHKGDLKPIIKSEPIPTLDEQLETSVFKLVGETHNDIINQAGKKILVKYYAPWCGHCKKLAPVYEELLSLIALDKQDKDKIVIANLDGTLNDVDVEITGYPTLILYEQGKEPVVYRGARDLESLAEFVGFDLNKEDDEEEHDEL